MHRKLSFTTHTHGCLIICVIIALTKCFRFIKSYSNQQLFQQDLNSLLNWSIKSNLSFKPSKSVHMHVSYNSKIPTLIIRIWVLSLGEICSGIYITITYISLTNDIKYLQAFSQFNLITSKAKLYAALVRSQLIWRPYLVQDINKLESIQRRVTKFIMNDYYI